MDSRHRETDESTRRTASCCYLFLGVWNGEYNISPKYKCLISDQKHVSSQMKTWWCFICFFSQGIKIHPPDPNGRHLLPLTA